MSSTRTTTTSSSSGFANEPSPGNSGQKWNFVACDRLYYCGGKNCGPGNGPPCLSCKRFRLAKPFYFQTTQPETNKRKLELIVDKVPETNSAYTNLVYISKNSLIYDGLSSYGTNYVKITKAAKRSKKEFVFPVIVTCVKGEEKKDGTVTQNAKLQTYSVVAEKQLSRNAVGMNGLQRAVCEVSKGDKLYATPEDTTTIEPWSLSEGTHLYKLEFELELLAANINLPEINELELAIHIKKHFAKHIFVRKIMIATEYRGGKLKLTCTNCYFFNEKTEDDDGDSRMWRDPHRGEFGILMPKTDVVVALSTKSQLSKRLTFVARPKSNKLLDPSWKFADMGIGGLDKQFSNIFRRAFASRLYPPEIINQLGIKHVKGMLLHGPPGTGKTLIARQIGKMLSGKEPKVVNGPEILNKFVGASEEKIRELFLEAEAEYAEKGDNSELHIIIFDEIDAICKARGTTGSTGVHDTVVNQLLTKIDGPNILNNILVIGMTNRKDMLDSALLRPGRLEVHIEIGLPDEDGRQQILHIHTAELSKKDVLADDVDMIDIAARTKNYSGAEIEGLVKNALSYALYGGIDVTKGNVEAKMELVDITVTMDHFNNAMKEVPPAFGVAEDELKKHMGGGLIEWGDDFRKIMDTITTVREQVKNSDRTPLMSILLHGKDGTGKTSIACLSALKSEYPFIKLISPETMVGWTDRAKCAHINKVFEDSYKSPLSLIVLDCIERLLDYVPIGPRFSNVVLQALLVLCKKPPQYAGNKLLIIGTTSTLEILEQMHFRHAFNIILEIPQLDKPEHIEAVLKHMSTSDTTTTTTTTTTTLDIQQTSQVIQISQDDMKQIAYRDDFRPIAIKRLLMTIEMAKQSDAGVTGARFAECLRDSGMGQR